MSSRYFHAAPLGDSKGQTDECRRDSWPLVLTGEPRDAVTLGAPTDNAALGVPFHLFSILVFVVIGRPNDYFLALRPFRLALVFTILTVIATMLKGSDSRSSLFALRETRLYLVLYAAMVVGIPFAVFRPGAFEDVILKYVVNITFFLLFVYHVDALHKMRRIACVLVVSVLLYNVSGFVNGQFMEGRYVLGRTSMFDPNDVAFVEVSLLGYALWVLVGGFRVVMKAAALTTVLSGVLLTLYTASRGGLLGLATFIVLFLWLRVPAVSKSFKGILLAALLVGAYFNADKINTERYLTLGSLEEDYNFGEGGRVDTWERGIRLFLENPLTGVGVGSFGPAIGYQRRDEGVLPKWQTAHNSYVLVLTETGIVGASAFILLIATCLGTFNRLRRSAPRAFQDEGLAVLPGLLLVGFAAQLVAATFLSQAYSMFFTLAFAMSAALNRMTAAATAAAPHPAPAAEPAPAVPRWTPPPRASTRG